MLKELRLTNIVLVESVEISFAMGFNVLSGESGSGKSAIMNALNLIAGERSDTSVIRRGADKGIVEAVFDIAHIPHVVHLLDEAGIDHDSEQDLIIRREISNAGKNRAFINNQLAQLSLLKQVSTHLFDIIGQHANQKLCSLDYHRQVVDLFGNLVSDVSTFAASLEEENSLRQQLDCLVQSESQRIREMEVRRMEIDELQEANIKEGEEEELFSEYSLLSNADEINQKTGSILNVLGGEKFAVLAHLRRQKPVFDHLIKLAPSLSEAASCYENACLELEEVAHTLRVYESRIEHNPDKATQINARLEVINRLKRKFGPSVEDMHNYLQSSMERLKTLENADADIEQLQMHLKAAAEKTDTLAAKLTKQRTAVAAKLQVALVKHLRSLNMPKVEFHVVITPQKRGRQGDDKIEFYLTPNVGEHRISIKECASGGELSRTLLAVQALLAGKEKIPTLVFDEVDANIGGETAAIVGEKLNEIAKQHQVLCITHFPQVAKQAEHHLRIYKHEIEGRTLTLVDTLDTAGQQRELARMLGGKKG